MMSWFKTFTKNKLVNTRQKLGCETTLHSTTLVLEEKMGSVDKVSGDQSKQCHKITRQWPH